MVRTFMPKEAGIVTVCISVKHIPIFKYLKFEFFAGIFPEIRLKIPFFRARKPRIILSSFLAQRKRVVNSENEFSLLEFDSKNIRINYDFLCVIRPRKPKVARNFKRFS